MSLVWIDFAVTLEKEVGQGCEDHKTTRECMAEARLAQYRTRKDIARYACIAFVLPAIVLAFSWGGRGTTNVYDVQVARVRAENGYVLQVRDLNGNGIPEKFYEIGGQKYFTEIDGKTVEDTLR